MHFYLIFLFCKASVPAPVKYGRLAMCVAFGDCQASCRLNDYIHAAILCSKSFFLFVFNVLIRVQVHDEDRLPVSGGSAPAFWALLLAAS